MSKKSKPTLTLTLDHVALVTPDLAAAKDDYERLGFTLTRQSSHKGAIEPGGPVEPWGSGNHCAMFRRGYFEILGITDESLYHDHFKVLADKFHGVQLLALGCKSARDLYEAWKDEDEAPVKEPVEVGRDVPVGLEGEETEPGIFRIVHLEPEVFPEAELFFIEQATPDALWQEALIRHANGVVRLEGVVVCSEEPDRSRARFERATRGALPAGVVTFESPKALAERYPGAVLPSVPCIAVVRFGVENLVATKKFLKSNDVTPHAGDKSVWLRPERAGGVILELEARG